MPLQDEERLFIEAIRDLNYQASKLQEEENQVMVDAVENDIEHEVHENENTPPLSPLSRLAALAVASEIENRTSVTLDIAAAAAIEAAQKAKHYSAAYNLERAMAWIPILQTSIQDITGNENISTVSTEESVVNTPVFVEGDETKVTMTGGSEESAVLVENNEDEVSLKKGSKRILKKVLAEQERKKSCRESKQE